MKSECVVLVIGHRSVKLPNGKAINHSLSSLSVCPSPNF